ncbi:hypothetical protein TCON_0683 [Astathelohania contejeani]|uniref:Major facilitator superfamily associated domain-containing protein n=1 Tax=Astathelohania contejeani TaxID=164912 RepID=A0ABQ7I124_9MICR|nr:hypothetical protein TCON_0683 [Thelohania contejeani]
MEIKTVVLCGVIYLFLTASIYTAHNFMEPITNEATGGSLSQFGLFDMFGIVKFFGAFFWTNLADRTKGGTIIGSICLIGYSLFFTLLGYAPDFMKARGLNLWTVLYFFCLNFFLSGCYPIAEYLFLEVLESTENIQKYYGKIRIGFPIGSIIAHGTQILLKEILGDRKDNLYNYVATGVYAAMATCMYFLLHIQIQQRDKKSNSKVKTKYTDIQINYSAIKKLFTFDIILLMLMSILQGIPRSSVATYLTEYQKQNKVTKSKARVLLMIRLIPEVSMLYLISYFEKFIGYKILLGIGLILGTLRPFLLGFVDIKWFNGYDGGFWIMMEIIKAVFSAFFGYSSSRCYKEKSNETNCSLAQGVASGCYNGMGAFISGFIAFFFLDSRWIYYQGSQLRGFFLITALLAFCGLLPYLLFIIKNRRKGKFTITDAKQNEE